MKYLDFKLTTDRNNNWGWGQHPDFNNNNNNINIGTRHYKFKPKKEVSTRYQKHFYYQHICIGNNDEFKLKSNEELHYEDIFNECPINNNNINNETNAPWRSKWNLGSLTSSPKTPIKTTNNTNTNNTKKWSFSALLEDTKNNEINVNNENNLNLNNIEWASWTKGENNKWGFKPTNCIEFHENNVKNIKVNDIVLLSGNKKGYVKYVGPVDGKNDCDVLYGVELQTWSIDAGDGKYNNKKYFDAAPGRGMFLQKKDILHVLSHYSSNDNNDENNNNHPWSWNIVKNKNENQNQNDSGNEKKEEKEEEVNDENK